MIRSIEAILYSQEYFTSQLILPFLSLGTLYLFNYQHFSTYSCYGLKCPKWGGGGGGGGKGVNEGEKEVG